MAAVITEKTGGSVQLVEGGGGIFQIRQDGEAIYTKEKGSKFPFPTNEEVAALFE